MKSVGENADRKDKEKVGTMHGKRFWQIIGQLVFKIQLIGVILYSILFLKLCFMIIFLIDNISHIWVAQQRCNVFHCYTCYSIL